MSKPGPCTEAIRQRYKRPESERSGIASLVFIFIQYATLGLLLVLMVLFCFFGSQNVG